MSHVVDVGSWPSQLAASQDSALLSKQDVQVRRSSEHAVAVEGSNGGKESMEGRIAGALGPPSDGKEGTAGKIAGAAGPLIIDGMDGTDGKIAGAPGLSIIDGNEGTAGKIAGAAGPPIIDGIDGTAGKIAGAVGPLSDGREATKGLVDVGWPKATGLGKACNKSVKHRKIREIMIFS